MSEDKKAMQNRESSKHPSEQNPAPIGLASRAQMKGEKMKQYQRKVQLGKIFLRFVKSESFSGVFLFISMVLALLVANSGLSSLYFSFWHMDFGFVFNDKFVGFDMQSWVNDVLMSFFFLMVGLEIKREFLTGELSGLQKAAFPVLAAIGGMIAPAIIYTGLNMGSASVHGFGIPMATDIAFALGVVLMLGKRVPFALKVFLVTLAVVDDLGAIVVIAVVYTSEILWGYLGVAGGIVAVLVLLNRFGVKSLYPYLILGVLLWLAFHESGVHATISAVILAFCIPLQAKESKSSFITTIKSAIENFYQRQTREWGSKQGGMLKNLYKKSQDTQSPLEYLEHKLHPWSAYFIMPLFAFANAGVAVGSGIDFGIDHIFLGVLLGLFVGKPLGIFLITFICARLKIATKPRELSWLHIFGAGMLSGIGFTMSIFVSNLAFDNEQAIEVAKVAILFASFLSAVCGSTLLFVFDKLKSK